MFGSDENSGIVGLLVGVMMLVFAGIFFSLLVDKRFSFSSGRISLETEIADQANQIESLEDHVEKVRELWRKSQAPLAGQDEQVKSLEREVALQTSTLAELEERKESLLTEVRDVEERFAEYRNGYLRQVRAAAIGEELGSLQTRSGKVFANATIREVNAAGMVVHHEQGLARLSPNDLDVSWNERFQWDAEEAEAQRRREQERMQAHLRSIQKVRERPVVEERPRRASRPAKPAAASREIEALRQEVITIRARMEEAETQAANARTEAQFSRGRSVPGSLETWEQRANRLDATARRLRTQYITVRGKLAAVAPRDPALREEPGRQ